MKIAYCDCFSGISGDMFLAALLDAGLPLDVLREQLGRLALEEKWSLDVRKVKKGALAASQVEIAIQDSHDHRHYTDIQRLIETSSLPERVASASLAVFQRLAEAEAHVHGTRPEEVHFHEVGAVDSILDIVGAAVGLNWLGIERLYASPLPVGSGTVQTQHGLLPVPAPATLQLMAAAHLKVVPSPAQVELVTPTGAAILAALATIEQPAMTVAAVGMGAGRRELPWPNLVRLVLGESDQPAGQHVVLETNIDDMGAEGFGFVMEKLFAAGALDVYFSPIQMKKNRPATLLGVIARQADEPALAALLLRETSTFGVRSHPVARHEAGRAMRQVQTEFGALPVKLKLLPGQPPQASPEYEACARLAREQGVPLQAVYQAALRAFEAAA